MSDSREWMRETAIELRTTKFVREKSPFADGMPSEISQIVAIIAKHAPSESSEYKRGMLAAADIADKEPELPGPIPEHIRPLILSVPLEEQQRSAVRATKKSIAGAIREAAEKGESDGK